MKQSLRFLFFLTTLPNTMVNLTKLMHLSLGNNHLQNLSPAVSEWVRRFDPAGLNIRSASKK